MIDLRKMVMSPLRLALFSDMDSWQSIYENTTNKVKDSSLSL